MVLGILGLYTSLFLLAKLIPSSKKKTVEATSSVSVSSDAVPSLDSPDFDKWIAFPGNIEKLLKEVSKYSE